MMILYGNSQSRSFRALWALEEADLTYEYRHVELGFGVSGEGPSKDYLSLNPQGKVPTLTDGELVITESAAILNYIGAIAPSSQLLPDSDPASRAQYDEMCFFILSELEQPLWSSGKHRFALPKNVRVPAMLDTAQWEFGNALAALRHHISDREFASGGRFSMADILLAHTLTWAEYFLFDVPEEFKNYRDKMYARSACKKALSFLKPT